jgi:tetratricopeptide (TPR) repeat protein
MMIKTKNQSNRLVRVLTWMGLALAVTSCQPIQQKIEPIIVYTPSSYRLSQLPSAFLPLSAEECQQEWSKELIIADSFSHELDLYRAITCYKRALILLPEEAVERRLQIEYDLILCYYLGQKYQEAVNIFEESDLTEINPLFPAFSNLLLILYDSYQHLKQDEKADQVLEAIKKCSPETAEDLTLFSFLKEGNLEGVQIASCSHRNQTAIQTSLADYYQYAKSPKKARLLNTILPGAGYYYIGQKKSALTAFIINTLFTAAAYQFFHRGYYAAGAITTSLEVGWYLGGINGAGLEAQEFNTRLYEGVSKKMMIEQDLFPILMFETTF